MGTIELMDGYFIEIDPLNYTLKQRYVGQYQDGRAKEAFRIHGYFPNLKSALKRFVDLVRLDAVSSKRVLLNEYVDAVEKADMRVMEFLEKLEVPYGDT